MACKDADEDQDHPEHFNHVVERAQRFFDAGQGREALQYLDSAYAAYPLPGTYDLYRKYELKATYYIGATNDLQMVERYIDSVLFVLKEHSERYGREYVEALSLKGFVLFKQNKFEDAFHYYYWADRLGKEYFDRCSYIQYSGNLAGILFQQHRYQQAIAYYKKSFEGNIYCDTTDFQHSFSEPQGVLDNIALCYENLGQLDSAILYYNRALAFIDQYAHRFPEKAVMINTSRAVVYGNLGSTEHKHGNMQRAEELLKEGLRINSQPGYANYDAQFTGVKLATLYLDMGRFRDAGAIMRQVRASLDTLPFGTAEMRWRKLAWNYYGRLADTSKAYESALRYYALKDSLDDTRKDLLGADYSRTFQNLSQQHQIEILTRDSQLKNTYLVLAAVFFIMAIVIIYLVWKNNRQSKTNVLTLTALNTQMQQTLEALEQSHEENTRMVKTVAHDLRSPIAAIISLSDILLQEAGHTTDHVAMIDMIRTSGNNALQVAGDILATNATAEMPMDIIALDTLILNSVMLMRVKAREKKQNILMDIEPVQVMANGEKMARVIGNLIVNAVKFSPEGRSIRVKLVKSDTHACVSITDEGIGIPAEIQERIFDAFTLAKREGTSGEQAFGLGLSISKQIIEAHNGRIWFESIQGSGTTFFVELPLTRDIAIRDNSSAP